jgi:hypothetical protein
MLFNHNILCLQIDIVNSASSTTKIAQTQSCGEELIQRVCVICMFVYMYVNVFVTTIVLPHCPPVAYELCECV